MSAVGAHRPAARRTLVLGDAAAVRAVLLRGGHVLVEAGESHIRPLATSAWLSLTVRYSAARHCGQIGPVAVAAVIMLAVWPVAGAGAGALAGIAFYAGREVRDWEKLGAFDWKGWLAPLIGNGALFLLSVVVSG